jgi:hypothetical protein
MNKPGNILESILSGKVYIPVLSSILNIPIDNQKTSLFQDKDYYNIKEYDILIKHSNRKRKICLVLWESDLQILCLYFSDYYVPLITTNYIQNDYILVQSKRMITEGDKRIINKIYQRYIQKWYV